MILLSFTMAQNQSSYLQKNSLNDEFEHGIDLNRRIAIFHQQPIPHDASTKY